MIGARSTAALVAASIALVAIASGSSGAAASRAAADRYTPVGNYVILALGHGRFAFYAHLKPHSVRVHRGERVRRGQAIAELGNSGSSTGPHLHFQVMNRPSAIDSDGLPFVFDRFHLRGRTPPIDESFDPTVPVPIDRADAGPRRREDPLGRDVVDFPRG